MNLGSGVYLVGARLDVVHGQLDSLLPHLVQHVHVLGVARRHLHFRCRGRDVSGVGDTTLTWADPMSLRDMG